MPGEVATPAATEAGQEDGGEGAGKTGKEEEEEEEVEDDFKCVVYFWQGREVRGRDFVESTN